MFARIDKDDYKMLSRLAMPLLVQNVACMSVGLIDAMFVGRISADAYGAIGIAVSLMNLMAGIFGCLAVAFNIVGSRKLGESNREEFREIFMSSLLLDVAIGVIYGILTVALCRPVFTHIYELTGEALSTAVVYSYITCPYMLFQLVIFSCSSYFKIMKNTGRLMLFSTGPAVLNVLLDYIFIFGKFGFPRLGAVGAAMATIISVFAGTAVVVWAAGKDIVYLFRKNSRYLERAKELIKVNLPIAGEELLEGSVFVVVIQAVISHIGIDEIGAYLLVKNVLDIALLAMYMYGSAELTLVSEKIGQKLYERIQKMAIAGTVISFAIYAVLSALTVIFRRQVPLLISDDMRLVSLAGRIIIPMVIMNLCNPFQTIYKYVLQACDDGKYVLYATALVNAAALGVIVLLYLLGGKMWSVFIGLFVNYSLAAFIYFRRLKNVVGYFSHGS